MSIIKPKRGTGSPAGSITTNEIAMDTAAKILYVSTNGTDAVNLADDSKNYLENVSYFLKDFYGPTGTEYPGTAVLGANEISKYGASNASLAIKTGLYGAGANKGPVKIEATSLDMSNTPIVDVLDPVNAQEAATKNYVDTTSALNLPLAGGTMSGDINMGDNDITNIKSLAISDTVGTNADMIIGQDQYSPNAIEILADKSQNNGKSETWYNFDNAGSKEYVGMQLWQADGGSAGSGDHYYRVASYKGSGSGNDLIIDSWKNHYTKIGNGFHDPSTRAPIGVLQLEQDKATLSYRLDINNGRTNSGSGLSPHALFCNTDMSQDTGVNIMNSATFQNNYGAQAVSNNVQNNISFSVENDAVGSKGVAKIVATNDSSNLNNRIRLQASNETAAGSNVIDGGTPDVGGNAKLEVSPTRVTSNVPFVLPQYTVAQINAIPSPGVGMQVWVTDGDAGSACIAAYDGTNWKVVALGATIST